MSQYAIGAGVAAGVCAGLLLVGGGIVTVALIPVFIAAGSSSTSTQAPATRGGIISSDISGSTLAIGSNLGDISLLDTNTTKIRQNYTESGSIKSLKFLDTFILVYASTGGNLVIRNINTGQIIRSVPKLGPLNSLVITKDYNIITSDDYGRILTFNILGLLKNNISIGSPINSISLLSNENLVTSQNNLINIWDTNFKLVKTIYVSDVFNNLIVAVPTNGISETIIYSQGSKVVILDPTTTKEIRNIVLNETITDITQLSNGLLAVSTSNSISYYYLATGTLVRSTSNTNGTITNIIANQNNIIIGNLAGGVNFISNSKFDVRIILPALSASATSISVLDNKVSASSSDGQLVIIDKTSGNILLKTTVFNKVPIVMIKSLDSFTLLAVSSNGILSYVDSESGFIYKTVSINENIVSSVVLSNGEILIGNSNGTIRVLDRDFVIKKSVVTNHNGPISLLIELKSGLYLSVNNEVAKIWSSLKNHTLQVEINNIDLIVDATEMSDGNIVTISRDGILRKWAYVINSRLMRASAVISLSFKVDNIVAKSVDFLPSGNVLIGTENSLIEYSFFSGGKEINKQMISATSAVYVDTDGKVIAGSANGEIFMQIEPTTLITTSPVTVVRTTPLITTPITTLTSTSSKVTTIKANLTTLNTNSIESTSPTRKTTKLTTTNENTSITQNTTFTTTDTTSSSISLAENTTTLSVANTTTPNQNLTSTTSQTNTTTLINNGTTSIENKTMTSTESTTMTTSINQNTTASANSTIIQNTTTPSTSIITSTTTTTQLVNTTSDTTLSRSTTLVVNETTLNPNSTVLINATNSSSSTLVSFNSTISIGNTTTQMSTLNATDLKNSTMSTLLTTLLLNVTSSVNNNGSLTTSPDTTSSVTVISSNTTPISTSTATSTISTSAAG
ncbi:unnamed protein product [Brachionus calyciflorus]|uniref:Uncharacterized protein n=1 Tax=Brachionus calyciflorus TaxID=104777 RepID=A0A814BT89_9BILA|nr:unnamed protein product [Brachionus calyciflorus]